MHFSEFARYLRKLEETSSRIALVEILAEMFGEVADSSRVQSSDKVGRLVTSFTTGGF